MNTISELYVFNSMPFVSILVGVGLGAIVTTGTALRRGALYAVLLLLLASHVGAVRAKSILMKEHGLRATVLSHQIVSHAARVPQDGILFLLNPPDGETEYSVFVMCGSNVFLRGLRRVNQLADRDDLRIRIIERAEIESIARRKDCLVLSLVGDRVQVDEAAPVVPVTAGMR